MRYIFGTVCTLRYMVCYAHGLTAGFHHGAA
jgi:hypothetical protein